MVNPISHDLQRVDEKLKEAVFSKYDLVSQISLEAIEGGKRIRPALLILWARATSPDGLDKGQEERMTDLAAAVELIHVASLVHDDILDESVIRRGKPSINSKWNSRMALLGGDYLLARAMYLTAKSASRPEMRLISRCLKAMCEGEMMQTWASGQIDLGMDSYLSFISMKTASLMETSCLLGAMISGANRLYRSARIYGLHFGIAFQIVDDIRDLIETDSILGKQARSDLIHRKLTAPLIYLRDVCDEEERRSLRKRLEGRPTKGDLDWIVHLVDRYHVIEHCFEMVERVLSVAGSVVEKLPASDFKFALEAMTLKLKTQITPTR
jgi:heptaprenyl diphosphate synthase